MRVIRYSLVLFVLIGPLAALARPGVIHGDFQYTKEEIAIIPEARMFRGKVGGVDIVGADIGPKNGRPLVLVGGFTTSFPYLRKFIRAHNKKGFRVFVYNPPGQGRGDLHSGHETDDHLLGIDGMLAALPAVRHFAYEQSGKQKAVIMGHSLGGFQVRVGSLGVIGTTEGHAEVSELARRQAKRETALIVPMFSFGMHGEVAFESVSHTKAMLLKDVAPLLMKCFEAIGCVTPAPIGALQQKAFVEYLKITQGNLHRGLFGAADLDHEELDALAEFLLPQHVSDQIREDLDRWMKAKAFTTPDGFDLGAVWLAQQTSKDAFPVLYIGGEHDDLTELGPFKAEAMALPGAIMTVVPTGHIGSFISETHPDEIAAVIDVAYHDIDAVSCEGLLKSKKSRR